MTIEHPPPTEATVKFLYAHAFGCAFEGCRRPLYRVDDETGIRTLNSRVCHINARREGGPRWSATQSAELNRSAENLILMCVEHAAAIDAPETLSVYPGHRLREWKCRLPSYLRLAPANSRFRPIKNVGGPHVAALIWDKIEERRKNT